LSLDTFQIPEIIQTPNVVEQKIKELQIDNMTPLEAISKLQEIQNGLQ